MTSYTLAELKRMGIDDLRTIAGDDELYTPSTRRLAQQLVDAFDA